MAYIRHIMNPRVNQTKIKVWDEEEQRWRAGYYYHIPSLLSRTIGYMCQDEIDRLPTRKELLLKVFRAKL